jgi:uncharacterized membrane protein
VGINQLITPLKLLLFLHPNLINEKINNKIRLSRILIYAIVIFFKTPIFLATYDKICIILIYCDLIDDYIKLIYTVMYTENKLSPPYPPPIQTNTLQYEPS